MLILHCKKRNQTTFQSVTSHQKENQMKLTEGLLLREGKSPRKPRKVFRVGISPDKAVDSTEEK